MYTSRRVQCAHCGPVCPGGDAQFVAPGTSWCPHSVIQVLDLERLGPDAEGGAKWTVQIWCLISRSTNIPSGPAWAWGGAGYGALS